MAHVLRKLLIPGLLALTSSALPAVAVAAPAPPGTLPAVGKMCLESNYPSTYIVSVKGCNSSVAGQHWAFNGEALYQTQYPNMCLESNYPSTYIVSVKGCNSSVAGQHWALSGEALYQTQYPNMCLESNYPSTYIVSVKGCNSSVAGQHWTVQGQQISETLF